MKTLLTFVFFSALWCCATGQSKSTHYSSSIRGMTSSGEILTSTHSKATTVNPWTEAIQQRSNSYRHHGLGSVVHTTDTSTNSVRVVTPFRFSAYPNPFQNTMQIQTSEVIEHVILHSSEGKEIPVKLDGNTITTGILASGVYLLEVRSGGQIGYVRLVKL
jgi:hypothetical protein